MDAIAKHLIHVQSETWHLPSNEFEMDIWDYHVPLIKNFDANVYPEDVIRYLDRRNDIAERIVKPFLSIWWSYRQSTGRPLREEDKAEIREYLRRK